MSSFISRLYLLLIGTLIAGCIQPVQLVPQPTNELLRIEFASKLIFPNRAVAFAISDTGFQGVSNPHVVWNVSDTSIHVEPILRGTMKCSFPRNGRYSLHINVFDSSTHQRIGTADTSIVVGFPADFSIATNSTRAYVGDSVLFFLTGQDVTPFRLEWDLGDSILQTTRLGQFASHTFIGAGDYPVRVRIFDSIGLLDSVSKSIHVSPVGGEFNMSLLKQFSRVRVYGQNIPPTVYEDSPLTWNLDTVTYSSRSVQENHTFLGVWTESFSSGAWIVVSELSQSLLSVFANSSHSKHYNGNNQLDWDYYDEGNSLSGADLRATIVSNDSICFMATGWPLVKTLRFSGGTDHTGRMVQEQSGSYNEKNAFSATRLPTLHVVFFRK